ncbi:proline-rich transmembrane protein 4-like [Anneissia japonica]|uniref:proline-rich transmembrane protein 4-like n=1 Tax=Anneissia japonica TaxID=1529436 RepID=UPI0014255C46|nr:proline-rich transmembrane protein 4-like [Anneissia japonica]
MQLLLFNQNKVRTVEDIVLLAILLVCVVKTSLGCIEKKTILESNNGSDLNWSNYLIIIMFKFFLLKCIVLLLCLNVCNGLPWQRESRLSLQNINVRRQRSVTDISSPVAEPKTTPESEPKSESEPKHEPETEVKSEPEGEAEGEPEPEPEPDAEPEPEPEDESGGEAFAEPTPNWTVAFVEWGWAWDFHCYFCGLMFAALAAYSFFCIAKLSMIRLPSRTYFIALNVIVVIMGVDRAVFLIVDPYGSKNILPLPVVYVMLGLGFPCLTSSFSILFMALLSATKMQPLSRNIQRPQVLGVIITFHYIISITSDVLAGKFLAPEVVLYVCQSAFILWGSFLFFSYLLIFRRLHRSAVRVSKEINHLSLISNAMSTPANELELKKPKVRWGSAVRVTLITALLGLGLCGLQLYGMLVVYAPNAEEEPQPWPWWIYQTIFRACEIGMCITMCFVATQPLRRYNPIERAQPQYSTRFTSFRSRFYLRTSTKPRKNERVLNNFEKPKSGNDVNLFETSPKKPNSEMNETEPLTTMDIGKGNVDFDCQKDMKQNNFI